MTDNPNAPHTLHDKIWNDHVVHREADGTCLLFIDRHLFDEVDSPQAFGGLRQSGLQGEGHPKARLWWSTTMCRRRIAANRNPDPQARRRSPISSRTPGSLASNIIDELDQRQGICHVVGPEQGFTLPGTTIVCGDSHTTTHGAFGALALGIGTTEN